ncbi:MAG: ribonuclease R, partial [Alicyclobacillus shizuokensis]|nr:ribonuclease R [Alicyclobacillus shizuokensis]
NGAEGLIHISYLTDDYYIHYEKLMALVGERTRRVFRLGDPVVVRVAAASKENLSIDFELVSHRREATMVTDKGVHTIEYDEDLSPKERRRRIQQRAQLAGGRDRDRRAGGVRGRTDRPLYGARRGSRRKARERGGDASAQSGGGSQNKRTLLVVPADGRVRSAKVGGGGPAKSRGVRRRKSKRGKRGR